MSSVPNISQVQSFISELGSALNPLTPRMFELHAGSLERRELTAVSFEGTEGMSRLFSFDVVALCDLERPEIEEKVLGMPATLVMHVDGSTPRVVRGIVTAVTCLGTRAAEKTNEYRLHVAPRMWLATKRKTSRIFQDVTIATIIDFVLSAHGVATRWALARKLTSRSYCVQYQETDYELVTRLLAEEGIAFHFEEPPGLWDALMEVVGTPKATISTGLDEVVTFTDEGRACPPITDGGSGAAVAAAAQGSANVAPLLPEVPFRDASGFVQEAEYVSRISLSREVHENAVTLRDYIFQRPGLNVTADNNRDAKDGHGTPLGVGEAGVGRLEVYDHHGEFEETDADRGHADIQLEQYRARARVAEGTSTCRRLAAGHRFRLVDASEGLSGDYTVSSATHVGHTPELRAADAPRAVAYENTFECVPAAVAFRPSRPPRKLQQVMESAIVVGPPGEEIHTDYYGRIKVHFHWDRENPRNEHSSCWMRVMQPWAGAGWGAQFIPRIGMEVLVSFLGGDEDRPVVIGCVYNGTHPTPHPLPQHKTRSGIRTQTTLGGDGYNEIAFEDQAGAEELYLRAQKDMRELVLNDHATRVGHDQFLQVSNDQQTHVLRDQSLDVGQDQQVKVGRNRSDTVTGNVAVSYGAHFREAISGNEQRRVEGRASREVIGEALEHFSGDRITMVRGPTTRANLHYVNGTARFVSTGMTEIVSDTEIVLRCGKSVLRLKPDAIEMVAPQLRMKAPGASVSFKEDVIEITAKNGATIKAKEIKLASETSEVKLNQTASVTAPQVCLATGDPSLSEAGDGAEVATKIALEDRSGKGIPYQHYVVLTAKGERIGGMVGKDGKDEIYLEDGDQIVFPDRAKTAVK